MAQEWADYSGACAVLVAESRVGAWHGMFTAVDAGDPDFVLSGQAWRLDDEMDFENPTTDYDRACAVDGVAAHLLEGRGFAALVIVLELDMLTWWQDEKVIVNGDTLPSRANLERVRWEPAVTVELSEGRHILMNAADHGGDPSKGTHFHPELAPGTYRVEWGQYGWEPDDPALVLWRFVSVL